MCFLKNLTKILGKSIQRWRKKPHEVGDKHQQKWPDSSSEMKLLETQAICLLALFLSSGLGRKPFKKRAVIFKSIILTNLLSDVISLSFFLNHCTDYREEKKVLNGKSYTFIIKNESSSRDCVQYCLAELSGRYLDIFHEKDAFTCLNLEQLTELYRSLTSVMTLHGSPFSNIPEHVFLCPQLEYL